jgi:Flp pilus assembly protein TadG
VVPPCRSGATALEFGIVAPVFLMLLLGTFQVGISISQYIALVSAAEAGAQSLSLARG